MIKIWLTLFKRDCRLAFRRSADIATTLIFFIMVCSLFPLGTNPDPKILNQIAPSILWVAALLANMLSLPRLFATDFADGSLEQLILNPQPLSWLVTAKVAAHWLITGLPIVILAPLIGLQYGLSQAVLLNLMIALLLGTPTLSFIGAIGAALTLGVRGSSLLIALLVLPLYIPVLIFGSGAVIAAQQGLDPQAQLSLLLAGTFIASALSPWAIATALKIAVE